MSDRHVIVEHHEASAGWAVFSGCEGDTPTLVAFFLRRSDAEDYIAACTADFDADWWLCDPDIAPAAMVADGLLIANCSDFFAGAEAVIAEAKINSEESDRLLREAVPKETQEKPDLVAALEWIPLKFDCPACGAKAGHRCHEAADAAAGAFIRVGVHHERWAQVPDGRQRGAEVTRG